MGPDVHGLIALLHQRAPYHYALALTGGGAGAAAWLLSVPGGSRTLLEVVVPYGEEALCEYLGRRPASFCSADTARAMAARARERARWLVPGAPVAGVGCTASLRSDRPKRGDHRFHLCVDAGERTVALALTLTKEARDRAGEEEVLDRVLLNALAEAFGLAERVAVPLLPGEQIVTEPAAAPDALAAFLGGARPALCVEPDGRVRADAPRPALLLCGSFNPLHEGHCGLAAVAARQVGAAPAFELSVVNADKPPLPAEEVRRRLAQFAWRAPIWLTRAPTFAEKADLFPGTAFVVGADTAARIVQPRFYGDSAERMATALGAFHAHGCRFLVAARVDAQGHCVGLDQIEIPPAFRDLFIMIPESAFRLDVSSTALRAGAAS
jgi:hypothetical protein